MLKYLKIFFLFISLSSLTDAQTFGFGCLGFVGGYGGFTYQQYNAAGLNEYIGYFNKSEFVKTPMPEFSSAIGYRVGLNIFRATFQNKIIITAKGYYQFLSKKNESSYITYSGPDSWQVDYSLDLDVKNWAIGLDVGWEFTQAISWKIVDGSLNFNYVTVTETADMPGGTYVNKYKSDAGVIGYAVGTGLIVAIIKDYVSIEGLIGYTYFSIENVYDDNGVPFLNSPQYQNYISDNFIDSGGFTAVIQLNVGFPLL